MYKKLRVIRIVVAAVAAVALTWAVATGVSTCLVRMQLIPALMACSGGWLALWALVTAVFGRAYCSTVCPMGFLMDCSGRLGGRKKHHCRPALNRLRYFFLVVTVVCVAAGLSLAVSVLDPFGVYSRIVDSVMAVVSGAPAVSVLSLAIAAGSLSLTVYFSLRRGRLLCNTVCPAGTLMGLLSRYSLYHPDINTDKCVGCGECVRVCKAECIDPDGHTVDTSRCVTCFNCVASCPNDAITYRRGRHRLTMPMMERVDTARPTAFESPDVAELKKEIQNNETIS